MGLAGRRGARQALGDGDLYTGEADHDHHVALAAAVSGGAPR
jgi:hypothetical protein